MGSAPARPHRLGIVLGTTVCALASGALLLRPASTPALADSPKAPAAPRALPKPPSSASVAPAAPACTPSCPPDMTAVGDTCIDRFEAHLVVAKNDGSFAPHPPHERPTGATFLARSAPNVKPQSYISRVEAALACEQAGKRLCGVSEWFRACSGPEKTTYPYGSTYATGRCNVGKPHLLSLKFGKDPHRWSYDEFNDPRLCQEPGFLAKAGEFTGCAAANGASDLVGNLHEWVADRVDLTLGDKVPLTDAIRKRLRSNTGKGIFMGGFFSTTNEHGMGCAFVTAAHEPGYHDYSTGFRCCKNR